VLLLWVVEVLLLYIYTHIDTEWWKYYYYYHNFGEYINWSEKLKSAFPLLLFRVSCLCVCLCNVCLCNTLEHMKCTYIEAEICVPFTQIQKRVRLSHSSHNFFAFCTSQGLSFPPFPPSQAEYNCTLPANHAPTILYLGTHTHTHAGTNLYLRKFWYFWPKLSQVQICSCYRIFGVRFAKSVVQGGEDS